MVEISASTVMKLRKMSGQGMMDCKKALSEANGDINKAMEILRKKGLVYIAVGFAKSFFAVHHPLAVNGTVCSMMCVSISMH